jgi:putative membrane protein
MGATKAGKGEESALEILKKRYARGEIDKEEFDQKKRDLQ